MDLTKISAAGAFVWTQAPAAADWIDILAPLLALF